MLLSPSRGQNNEYHGKQRCKTIFLKKLIMVWLRASMDVSSALAAVLLRVPTLAVRRILHILNPPSSTVYFTID